MALFALPGTAAVCRAARENRIESLHAERETLSERFATLSFDVQKTQRLHQAFSRFIGSHLGVAFQPDPEAEIRKLNTRRGELERALASHENDNQQSRVQFEQAKEGVAALNRILPRLNLLADDTLADRVDEIQERLDEAQEAARFVQQHGNQLAKLEPMVSVLQSDPEQFEQLKEDYARVTAGAARSASAGVCPHGSGATSRTLRLLRFSRNAEREQRSE